MLKDSLFCEDSIHKNIGFYLNNQKKCYLLIDSSYRVVVLLITAHNKETVGVPNFQNSITLEIKLYVEQGVRDIGL